MSDQTVDSSEDCQPSDGGAKALEWQHVLELGGNTVQCKHCKKDISRKIERIKNHFSVFNSKRCEKLYNGLPPVGSIGTRKITDSAVRSLTFEEQKNVDKEFALFCYTSGTPMHKVDNPHIRTAFAMLRPGATLPSRKVLSTTLLDAVYDETKSRIESSTGADTKAFVCITTDTTTNTIGIPITNFMCMNRNTKEAVFYDSIAGGDTKHTAQVVANEVSSLIERIGANLVAGSCTDNASTNK